MSKHFTNYILSYLFLFTAIMLFNKTGIQTTSSSTYWICSDIMQSSFIEKKLQEKRNSKSIHIFSHGRSGELLLDGKWSNAENITKFIQSKFELNNYLYLNIYGCEFAKGEEGIKAIEYLENALGLCVAASDDITGIKGDWDLEIGHNHTTVSLINYQHDLQCTSPEATVFAIQSSCTNGIPNDDGFLQISSVLDGDRVNYSTGSVYIGNDNYSEAIPIVNFPFRLIDGLANPVGIQHYTIRIFNQSSDCFTDVILTMKEQDCSISCDCEEYIYLNETSDGGKVHKFISGSTFPLSEILNNGNAWYPSSGSSELVSPHGLGSDSNGFLYIGEGLAPDSGIRRLSCQGEIIDSSEYFIPVAVSNIESIGNVLYTNNWYDNGIWRYDLCTGENIGNTCLNNSLSFGGFGDWGFSYNRITNMFYVSDGFFHNQARIWAFTEAEMLSGECIDPIIEFNNESTDFVVGSSEIPPSHIVGIQGDNEGNMYVVERDGYGGSLPTRILKFDANGGYLNATNWDTVDGDGGWYNAIGIEYSQRENLLFVSTGSPIDDCVSVFDTDLNYLGVAVPPASGSTIAKGIAIQLECCPSNNRQTVNQMYCQSNVDAPILLNELFPCEGLICEGMWMPSDAASATVYNECDQSINNDIVPGCYAFTKRSDGINESRCGAFEINFNLEILTPPDMIVSSDQKVCVDDTPEHLTVSTSATNMQWQMNTTNCMDSFVDIEGANSSIYSPPTLDKTTYYRVMIIDEGNCTDGICSFFSNCITIEVEDCDYPTNDLCLNSACHFEDDNIYLGTSIDSDNDDGVFFPNDMRPNSRMTLPITIYNNSGNSAYMNAWIDWNDDGDFDDVNEQIASEIYDVNMYSGNFIVYLPVDVPSTIVTGEDITAVFRLSTDQVSIAESCGIEECAPDGEVEDYIIQIDCNNNICLPPTIKINK